MIKLEKVRKRYFDSHAALRGIDLDIHAEEMVFLTGHSGAGKSTLLRLIALLERPTAGKIIFDGVDLATLKPNQIPQHRRRVGMIFQNPTLLYDRSVFDNIALPLQINGYNLAEIQSRVQASLELVGLFKKANKNPIVLSSGEQQRVGIARAIVTRPDVILADEPTGNLDPELSKDIMNLFHRLNQVGITIVVASHDLELIKTFNCRQIELKNGLIHLQHNLAAGAAS